ncbi:MAG: amino acid ABC transporter permease [Chloroflexota bacterium]
MAEATITTGPPAAAPVQPRGSFSRKFNWRYFLQDNITGNRWLFLWVLFLTVVTVGLTYSQLQSAPVRAGAIVGIWGIAVVLSVVGELFTLHTPLSRWLNGNMLNSVSNTIITLLLALLVGMTSAAIWSWGYVDATFAPEMTAPDVRSTGASWGVIWGARKLLLTGLLEPEHTWRVAGITIIVGLLWLLTYIATRPSTKTSAPLFGTMMNYLWLASPFLAYIFLAGLEPVLEDRSVTFFDSWPWTALGFNALVVGPIVDIGGLYFNVLHILYGIITALALMMIFWFFSVIRVDEKQVAYWLLGWPVIYVVWRLIAATEIFTPIDVDKWGGLLLTVIFAIFVNILSFPIGILLALGRRNDAQGIPPWITWPIAIVSSAYLLYTSSAAQFSEELSVTEHLISFWPLLVVLVTVALKYLADRWELPSRITLPIAIAVAGYFLYGTSVNLFPDARNIVEGLFFLWPLLIPIANFYFHRSFDGNVVQAFSILSIEIIRGVPLITLLFMAIIMAPFFAPVDADSIPKFWAVIIGYTIFSAAYMAELVRGGLQALGKGQYEASDSLGLNTLQKYRFIILPQALRILIPPLAGAVIATFKSSSLVALVGMIDLVGVVRAIIANQEWLGLRSELYAFMFVLYFLVSSVVSAYSRRLEERTGLGVR